MKISKIFSITVLAVTFGLLLNSNAYADFNLTLEDIE